MSYGSREWQIWILGEEEYLPLLKKAYELGIFRFVSLDSGVFLQDTLLLEALFDTGTTSFPECHR